MKVLITGANRGLGLELTREAVKRGHSVYAGVRNLEYRVEQLQQLQSDAQSQVSIIQLDVAEEATCQQAASKLARENMKLDAIINNAGILTERSKTIEELDIAQVERTFQINLFGPMRVIKHFLPLVNKGPDATIINISSEAGSFQNAYGGDYPYALSKSGLNMFSEQLRKYLADKEVSVYAVHPGWIKTDMGGEHAPGTPEESARGIMDIIEKKQTINHSSSFINSRGEAMPL
ncbi:SDR family oxidoreductase [Metabacillus malikii]|uniref:NAD(P)-dependent dehydrogenase (Short-subunit alcohol dehydrogenase family) n=1 Tax=Metabacillus malikii TaxID=1504265 RepID=A0ABT9ZAN8_9BACI|nr:SDR family oxidoreductase [Metabacillus malikii]MDQ0229009.1 NAD(P)-dependent dehydrogenase (short-subunit alcohol dehydrogenase family) [Metabacillus malikii]